MAIGKIGINQQDNWRYYQTETQKIPIKLRENHKNQKADSLCAIWRLLRVISSNFEEYSKRYTDYNLKTLTCNAYHYPKTVQQSNLNNDFFGSCSGIDPLSSGSVREVFGKPSSFSRKKGE